MRQGRRPRRVSQSLFGGMAGYAWQGYPSRRRAARREVQAARAVRQDPPRQSTASGRTMGRVEPSRSTAMVDSVFNHFPLYSASRDGPRPRFSEMFCVFGWVLGSPGAALSPKEGSCAAVVGGSRPADDPRWRPIRGKGGWGKDLGCLEPCPLPMRKCFDGLLGARRLPTEAAGAGIRSSTEMNF